MIVFLLMSVGLYITSFFTFPVADMRAYFNNLPILMCVFIPAVTMRMWAEDRKENTWELLLTFPMRARELVLGKFIATVIFFAITLAATCTVPLMLVVLGNPDNGAIVGGYLGTLLLGAFFLSIGIFVSGFCKDQIVAFVLSLLVCFAIFLVGTNFIAAYIDGVVSGLGSLLAELVGMYAHFTAFTRGVVELSDILYFVVWTCLFLFLNIMYIEGRSRAGARVQYSIAVALCFGIGFAFNWLLAGQSLGRFDLTEEKIYTMSPASKEVLSKLDDTVQVKVYITPKAKMPTGMKDLEQDISDKLEELSIASGGKVEFKSIHLEAANVIGSEANLFGPDEEPEEEDETEAIEKRMLDKGVAPFGVQAIVDEQVTQTLVYSAIGIAYQDKKEEILPQIDPSQMQNLEYNLVNTIFKLSRPDKPTVALVAPKEAVVIPPEMRQIYQQMGQPIPTSEDPYEYLQLILEQEKYEVSRVELTQASPLPEDFDTLVVVNPRTLNARQKWEINRALHAGKSVVLAVQNYEWNYQAENNGRVNLTKREQTPLINDLLSNYGLGVEGSILMDTNSVPLTMQSGGGGLQALFSPPMTINLSTHMLINQASMSADSPITSRLGTIFYLWGAPLTLDATEMGKYGLTSEVLMSTSANGWKAPGAIPPTAATFDEPATGKQAYPIMAKISGQFPDVYSDDPRPEWPPPPPPQPGMPPTPPPAPDAEATPVNPAQGELILLGGALMFNKNFLQGGNLDLFLNCVDSVTLGDELATIRGKKPIDRSIDRPSDRQRTFWRFANYGLGSILIAAVGISSTLMRKRSRNAYTMDHMDDE
jgi:ABC-type transport system involved in multi-copper enzyme maturation permease subunit